MALDETRFQQIADGLLEGLMETVDDQLGDRMDVDLESGILTIELEDGGKYVINKHAPNRQVWMSSPKGGATHYDFDPDTEAWTCTRSRQNLIDVLAAELGVSPETLSG